MFLKHIIYKHTAEVYLPATRIQVGGDFNNHNVYRNRTVSYWKLWKSLTVPASFINPPEKNGLPSLLI